MTNKRKSAGRIEPVKRDPIELLELDPWSKVPRTLPDGAIFVCAYGVTFNLLEGATEAAFLVRGERSELWLSYLDHPEEKALRRKRIPTPYGHVVAAMSLEIEPAVAAQSMMEALVGKRALYGGPDTFLLGGLLDKDAFTSIVEGVLRRRFAQEQAALRFADTPIVVAARECGLSPRPSGTSDTAWLAQCPGTNHFIMIGAASGEFGCGWCQRRGGVDELRAFKEERHGR